jgi:hypothetical protein
MTDDRDLEAAFRRLREADESRSRSLPALLSRRVPARPRLTVGRAVALPLALAGLLAGAAWLVRRGGAPRPVEADLWAWRSPTRALLPPDAGVGALPRIGETWGAPASFSQLEEPK